MKRILYVMGIVALLGLTGCYTSEQDNQAHLDNARKTGYEESSWYKELTGNPLTPKAYPPSDYAAKRQGLEWVVHHYTCPDVSHDTVRMTTRWAADYAEAQYREREANRIPKQAHKFTWSNQTTFSVERSPGEHAKIKFEGRTLRQHSCLR